MNINKHYWVNRLLLVGVILAFALSAVGAFAKPALADAAVQFTKYTLLNREVIQDANGKLFVSDNINTPFNAKFNLQGDADGCQDYIKLDEQTNAVNSISSLPDYAPVYYSSVKSTDPLKNGCIDSQYAIKNLVGSPENSSIVYKWIDSSTVERIGSGKNLPSNTYTYDSGKSLFIEQGGSSCPDTIRIGNPDRALGYYNARSTSPGEKQIYGLKSSSKKVDQIDLLQNNTGTKPDNFGCYETGEKQITISFTSNSNKQPSQGENTGSAKPADSQDAEDASAQCKRESGFFGWIGCGLLDATLSLYGKFTDTLQNLLDSNPANENSPQLKAAWSSFRIIASIGIVIVALIMVISQILSFEVFSAYTIKKILPRLVIAAIAIQLSWVLFTTLLNITITIGNTIGFLVLAPFGGREAIDQVLFNQGGGFLILGALGAAALFAAGLYAVAGVALFVGLSVFTALFTLIIRQVLIIALLIVSPLALLLWILPGTQKYWSKWWSTYIGLLLMYPLIVLLINAGKIGAYIINSSTLDYGTAFKSIAVIIAFFGPLFLIPKTFKFGGELLTGASGALSKASSGINSSLGKKLDERKALTNRAQAKGQRDALRKEKAGVRFANDLSGTGLKGEAMRRRYGGATKWQATTRERMQSSAQATAEKALEAEAQNAFASAKVSEVNYGTRGKQMRALAEKKVGENATLGEGVNQRTVKVTQSMREMAMNQLAQDQNISELRGMRSNIDEATWNKTVSGSANYAGIKAKAPQLHKKDDPNSTDPKKQFAERAELRNVGGKNMSTWDADTWGQWANEYKRVVDSGDAAGYVEMEQQILDLEGSIEYGIVKTDDRKIIEQARNGSWKPQP